MLENVEFEGFFGGVGKLHPRVGKKFYAIVMKGIVGRGDDHAGFKIILAYQAGYAGCGDDAREGHRCAGLRQTRGQDSGDMRAGFAGVHADKHAGSGMLAMQIGAQSVAGGE